MWTSGLSQGDTQNTVVGTISSAINADSMSLDGSNLQFDDNIPVVPNRKGIGKPEIVSDIPSANIKDLADLDYWKANINMAMKFPASYGNFTQALGNTAVSLIRGDIRYAKLCASVRSKIEDTINEYVSKSKFDKYEVYFSLAKYPDSESDDVMEALGGHLDLAKKVEDFVCEGDDKKVNLHRLQLIQDLYKSTTSTPMLQDWFDNIRNYITDDEEVEAGAGGR